MLLVSLMMGFFLGKGGFHKVKTQSPHDLNTAYIDYQTGNKPPRTVLDTKAYTKRAHFGKRFEQLMLMFTKNITSGTFSCFNMIYSLASTLLLSSLTQKKLYDMSKEL
ncbi:Uncharacterized protein PHPALM_10190 [Phytophthora palmivora]|uniref:Uncharacterized protein n=1 Tax=Phytophthora palmivora TaxID=4796 RepID=A0A2P4Y5C3_9STRA|nr:Uncharacterized protein PHPALM_10190 [Phytophthora palmivora]